MRNTLNDIILIRLIEDEDRARVVTYIDMAVSARLPGMGFGHRSLDRSPLEPSSVLPGRQPCREAPKVRHCG